jgi:exodeoxyribonuclease-3
MKIATFNAASVRARLPVLIEWLATEEPDVLAIQETKVEDDKFPLADFEELGYNVAIHGQKAWNGVAILSRSSISSVRTGFGDELFPNDCRIISCQINGLSIINTYVPNGNTVGSDKFVYKLAWLDRFRKYLDENYHPDDMLLWLGDINVAPEPIDVYDSKRMLGGVGHHPDEFSRLAKIVDFGLTDVFRKLEPGPSHYTFFDFTLPRSVEKNLGWRIDHIYATKGLAELCTGCEIDMAPRSWTRPSDHTFVVAEFDL